MSELTEKFREEFKDKETRRIYVDDFLNTLIATQIKVLREQRGLTQAELAELAGMRQERISVLEDVDYSSWTINVLRRLAEAFDLRLSVKFESFGSFLHEFENFSREALERPSFEDDPEFSNAALTQNIILAEGAEPTTAVYHLVGSPAEVNVMPRALTSYYNLAASRDLHFSQPQELKGTPLPELINSGQTFDTILSSGSTTNLLEQEIA